MLGLDIMADVFIDDDDDDDDEDEDASASNTDPTAAALTRSNSDPTLSGTGPPRGRQDLTAGALARLDALTLPPGPNNFYHTYPRIKTRSVVPRSRRYASPKTQRKSKPKPNDLLPNVNIALGLDAHGHGNMSLNASNGAFPSFLDSSPIAANPNHASNNGLSGVEGRGGQGQAQGQRQAPLPASSGVMAQQAHNGNVGVGNGGNGLGMGMPVNAGGQMDVNMVFQRLLDLGEVLRENRERTAGIVRGAEELATRAAANGASPSLQEANHEISAARIADLTRQVNQLQQVKQILVREQRENTKLIGEYETSLGNIVEEIRNFAYGKNLEKAQLSREYNKLLQEEKEAHLATRLEKDDWHVKFMRSVEMIRNAYKLRCEEEEAPVWIIAGLQNEVRSYRNALGMEPEKFNDETGYEVLRYMKNGSGEA